MFKNVNWKHVFAVSIVVAATAVAFLASPAGSAADAALRLSPGVVSLFAVILAAIQRSALPDTSDAPPAPKVDPVTAAANALSKSVIIPLAFALGLGAVGGTVATSTGCAFWQKAEPTVVADVSADAECVLSAILAGAGSPAAVVAQCGSVTVDQVLVIAKSLFDFYALGQTDAGLASAALLPYKGVPLALAPADLEKLRAFVGAK